MARLSTKTLRGIGVMDPRWVPANLHAAGTTATQADPRPGSATTSTEGVRAAPQVQGAQTETLNFEGIRNAGNPGLGDDGGAVGYWLPDSLETVADVRSWDVPLRTTMAAFGGTEASANAEIRDAAVCPLSGIVYVNDQEAPDAPLTVSGCALAFVPGTTRLLAMSPDNGQSLYSDDYGFTWQVYAEYTPLTDIPGGAWGHDNEPRRAAFDGAGNILLMAKRDDGTSIWQVNASSDLGATWSPVGDGEATPWDILVPTAHPNGSIIVVLISAITQELAVAVLGGAHTVLADVDRVLLELGTTWVDATVGVDDDGIIWVLARPDLENNRWDAWYSLDAGASFVGPIENVFVSDTGDDVNGEYWYRPRLVFSNGSGWLVYTAGPGNNDMRHGTIKLGGWAGRTYDIQTQGTLGPSRLLSDRWNWGLPGAGYRVHQPFYSRPGQITSGGWTETKTGAGAIASGPKGTVQDVTAAGDTAYASTAITAAGGADADKQYAETEAYVDSVTDWYTCLEIESPGYHWRIDATKTEWRVYDVDAAAQVGAAVARVATVGTADRIAFRVGALGGALTVLWREYDGSEGITMPGSGVVLGEYVEGTRWAKETRTIGGGSHTVSQATVRFGYRTTSTTVASGITPYLNAASDSGGVASLPELTEGVAEVWGKSVGSEYAYPVPDTYDTEALRVSRMVLRGGPVVGGDSFALPPSYGYPIDAVFPTVEPSPDVTWRSSAKGVNQDLAVELAAGHLTLYAASYSIALCVRNANVRSIGLYRKKKPAPFGLVATLDLATGFTGLSFVRAGDHIRPASTGAQGARFIRAGELVGGHVILDPTGTPIRRKILQNSGGFWGPTSFPAVQVRPDILLEDPDSGDPTSGTAHLVWPSGVLYVHDVASTTVADADQYMIRIASTEGAVEDYYELGDVCLYGLRVPGKQWAHGWEIGLSPNIRVDVDPYGTQRRTQMGPAGRYAQLTWGDGQRDASIRGAQGAADYLGSSVGEPLAVQDDVWAQVDGIYQITQDGALPVLLALAIPDATGVTITDPTLWLAGYIEGDHRVQEAAGRAGMGTDTFYRAGPLRIIERV